MADYVIALKLDFGDFLKEVLRDRLVCAIRDEHIQRKLLAVKKKLMFQVDSETAVAMEMACQNELAFRPHPPHLSHAHHR